MGLRLLPIAKPCSEPYDEMPGDERTRFCDKCEKHVFTLSARTEAEAREILATTTERVCVRYAKTAAGAILFAAVAGCSSAVPPATAADWDQGDGVMDVEDKCPDEPALSSNTEGKDGCPSPNPGK